MATIGKAFCAPMLRKGFLFALRSPVVIQHTNFCSKAHQQTLNLQPKVLLHHVTRRGFRQRRKTNSGSKKDLEQVNEVEGYSRSNNYYSGGLSDLVRPFGFTVMVSGCSFVGAAIWQYENLRKVVKDRMNGFKDSYQRSFFRKAGGFRDHINLMWNDLNSGQKLVAGIIGINIGVYLMWKVPALRTVMNTYFVSSPVSAAPCLSMVLSTFSHYSFLHLAVNMYVLWSFCSPITKLLGKEQFLAMYMSAGVISAFTSYMNRIARMSLRPSLGASGAIIAVLGAVCTQHPNAKLTIVGLGEILPISFSADSAMKALIVMDTVGLVLGFSRFDHAAHLGGMLFGIWYIKYGHKMIWSNREPLMKKWHEFRGKP